MQIKCLTIIDKLRLSLKFEEGKQEITLNTKSIKKILEEIIPDLKDKYKNRVITIEGNDISIKVDETLISMAISNLIENALKYSEDEVIISLGSDFISIKDTGIGIQSNELEKIQSEIL